MAHPPVVWDEEMMRIIALALGECAKNSPWKIIAASIEPTHFYALLTYSPLNIDRTVKWLGQEMTKAVHRGMGLAAPVFCKGRWLQFVFDLAHWNNVIKYIEAHNVRHGLARRPFDFLDGSDRG